MQDNLTEDNLNFDEDHRPWGTFRRFTLNTSSTVKILKVKPNEELSLQSHKKRSEFWHVISGSGFFELDDNKKSVKKGDELYIPKEAKHRISSTEEGIEVLEISFGIFDENDEVKYKDKYGRV